VNARVVVGGEDESWLFPDYKCMEVLDSVGKKWRV
jgi:hypothetical protein